jgi:CRISPR-associated protein Cas2
MEPAPGVFLGHVSALVRDALWEKCIEKMELGGCILIHSWPSEQGFQVRSAGRLSREIVDNEGLFLVRKPTKQISTEQVPENPDT